MRIGLFIKVLFVPSQSVPGYRMTTESAISLALRCPVAGRQDGKEGGSEGGKKGEQA